MSTATAINIIITFGKKIVYATPADAIIKMGETTTNQCLKLRACTCVCVCVCVRARVCASMCVLEKDER